MARMFSPFNFSVVPDFPNVVPVSNEWNDYLPIFRECKEDNPAQDLSDFHELLHQWEIHHEDVLIKMFMFSLAGDACEWYHSLPPASIYSLGEFHVAFNMHYHKLYPLELIFHSCCEGYHKRIQGIVASYVRYEDEDQDEAYALSELMDLVKSLSVELEELEAEHEGCLFEENAEDFPSLEEDVLGSSIEDDDEYFTVVEALYYAPEALVLPSFDDYSDEEQHRPT